MDSPLVVVPSFGRAGRVSTVRVFPEGVIVVPERQRETYAALQELPDGWEIVTVPDEEDGNIARKRNAILRLYAGRDIAMVDDDYDYIGSWDRGIDKHLGPEDVRHLLSEGFRMVRELGTVLWGINVQVDRKFYREYTPLSVTNIVLGPFLGLTAERPADLMFDEDIPLKEDYDFALQVLRRYHRILRLNRYHYMVDHLGGVPGGLTGTRIMPEEVRQNHRLQAKWGSDVVKVQLHRSTNPIIKVPLRGV